MEKLLFYDREGYLDRGGIIPKQICDIASDEDRQVQLILASLQCYVDACRDLEKKSEEACTTEVKKRKPARSKSQ
jgi:hypothetical protein